MDKQKIIGIVVLVGLFFAGFWYGDQRGYNRAKVEVKKVQEEAAAKAAEEAAKAANPFQAVNPLGGIESNPFEKAKKALNPFD